MIAPQGNPRQRGAAGAAGCYSGVLQVNHAVILSGPWLNVVRRAVLNAEHSRRRNGLPPSREYTELLAAVESAMSATGHSDVRTDPEPTHSADEYITVTEAARRLGISTRQTRRIADQLGAHKHRGAWFIDPAAVADYLAGR